MNATICAVPAVHWIDRVELASIGVYEDIGR